MALFPLWSFFPMVVLVASIRPTLLFEALRTDVEQEALGQIHVRY